MAGTLAGSRGAVARPAPGTMTGYLSRRRRTTRGSARREQMSLAAVRAGPAMDERGYTARWKESPRPAGVECCTNEEHRHLTRGSYRGIRGPTMREPTSAELDRIRLLPVRWRALQDQATCEGLLQLAERFSSMDAVAVPDHDHRPGKPKSTPKKSKGGGRNGEQTGPSRADVTGGSPREDYKYFLSIPLRVK